MLLCCGFLCFPCSAVVGCELCYVSRCGQYLELRQVGFVALLFNILFESSVQVVLYVAQILWRQICAAYVLCSCCIATFFVFFKCGLSVQFCFSAALPFACLFYFVCFFAL